MEKIKISQAVIVEGKYDKIKLENIIDAFILETNGFGIFKDKEKLSFIKKLADERGIIILTDSDHAGFMIRNHLTSAIPKEKITNVYIPDIMGKEKRKTSPSKEGKIGVEGMSKEILLEALNKANINCESIEKGEEVTNYDLFELGLSGTPNAKQNKKKLLKKLELPEFLSTSSLLSCINNMMTREEFLKMAKDGID
jgi:ribonuclease M5